MHKVPHPDYCDSQFLGKSERHLIAHSHLSDTGILLLKASEMVVTRYTTPATVLIKGELNQVSTLDSFTGLSIYSCLLSISYMSFTVRHKVCY